MKSFTHIHASGYRAISGARLLPAAKRYNADADLVTYTECVTKGRDKAIEQANGDTFHLVRGHNGTSNDGGISFRKDRFSLVYQESHLAANNTYFRSNGAPTPKIYATIAVLRDKLTEKVYVVSVMHMASHVEGYLPRNDTLRTRSWYACFRGARKRANQLARRYNADVLFVADWNINFKRSVFRALVKSLAPRYKLNWKHFPPGGTHGNRVIDATIIKGKVASSGAHLYPDDNSSDHRPYIETLRS